MSDLLLLPGNGAHNRGWIESVQASLGGNVLYYGHWAERLGGERAAELDFPAETGAVRTLAAGRTVDLFAKSAGCLLALRAVAAGAVSVRRAVLVGLPLRWAADRGIDVRALLADWTVPTLFIQNVRDPAASAPEVRALVPDAPFLELPGEDHDYLDLDLLLPTARAWYARP